MKTLKITLLFLFTANLYFTISAQNVYIPDVALKNALLNNLAINTNGDTAIQVSEAVNYKGEISVCCGDSDLTGLEYFTSLTSLNINFFNNLTHLDLSKNAALTSLDCNGNQLISIDVSKNIYLTSLNCGGNQLTSLDVSKNKALYNLKCSTNQLTNLDLSKNYSLQSLDCSFNHLTSIDVSKNKVLVDLDCRNNNLSSLDLSEIYNINALNCIRNQLTSLNVKNGNNTKLLFFHADMNPNLNCIEVDSVAWAKAYWICDTTASFSTNCGYEGIQKISGENALTLYPNPVSNNFTIQIDNLKEAYTLEILNTTGQVVLNKRITNSIEQVDLSGQAVGVYFVKLQSVNNSIVKKIIKHNN